MDEAVLLAILRGDEAKALRVVEGQARKETRTDSVRVVGYDNCVVDAESTKALLCRGYNVRKNYGECQDLNACRIRFPAARIVVSQLGLLRAFWSRRRARFRAWRNSPAVGYRAFLSDFIA